MKNFYKIGRFFTKPVPQQVLICLFFAMFSAATHASAQTDSSSIKKNNIENEAMFSVGVGVQHGFIFPHSEDVQNTSGARPTGIEATLSWQRNDSASYALCRCYPRQGLLLAYYDYDVALLGKSGTAAYFLEPTYRIADGVLFSLKGSAGLSYISNPFDSLVNPANQSYSTRLNVYLLVGVGVWVKLSENWWLNPSINYQHISNGGMRQPNKGINWPTAGLSLSYQPVSQAWYRGKRTTKKFWREYSARYDVSVLGTMRRGYDQSGNRTWYRMGGLALQAAKQVGRLSMITLGTEVYHDDKLRDKIQREGLGVSSVKAGLLLGHEFLLGRFQFSQRLGVYVFDQTPYYDRIFHRWGIKYSINRYLSTGINLLAHREVAEFIDFRLTYTFQRMHEQE